MQDPPGYFMTNWVRRGTSNVNNTGHSGKPGEKFPVNNVYLTHNSVSLGLSIPSNTPLYAKKILSNQRVGNLYGTFGIGPEN